MENISITEKLSNKIESLLTKYNEIVADNANLREEIENLNENLDNTRNELTTTKAQNEAKDNTIRKLEEEVQLKELEIEDVLSKIEQVLG